MLVSFNCLPSLSILRLPQNACNYTIATKSLWRKDSQKTSGRLQISVCIHLTQCGFQYGMPSSVPFGYWCYTGAFKSEVIVGCIAAMLSAAVVMTVSSIIITEKFALHHAISYKCCLLYESLLLLQHTNHSLDSNQINIFAL